MTSSAIEMQEGELVEEEGGKIRIIRTPKPAKQKSRMSGPDGARAWVVALAACVLCITFAGLSRISGIFCVSFMNLFGLNRKDASYPFTVRQSSRTIVGPIIGLFGELFGVQRVAVVGAVLGTFSAAICFFAEDVGWFTIWWGAMGGISAAATTTLFHVVIGKHFKKYQSTASGVAYSGNCIGSFIFPGLFNHLMNEYGLQGSFLLLAGVMAHSIPAAMLLNKPDWPESAVISQEEETADKNMKIADKHMEIADKHMEIADKHMEIADEDKETADKDEETTSFITKRCSQDSAYNSPMENKENIEFFEKSKSDPDKCESAEKSNSVKIDIDLIATTLVSAINDSIRKRAEDDTVRNESSNLDASAVLEILRFIHSDLHRPSSVTEDESDETKKGNAFCEWVKILNNNENMDKCLKVMESLDFKYKGSVKDLMTAAIRQCDKYKGLTDEKSEALLDEKSSDLVSAKVDCEQPLLDKSNKKQWIKLCLETLKTALKVFKNPMFLFISFNQTAYFMTLAPTITCIVDYGLDKSLDMSQAEYLITAFSAGDLFGRVFLGFVTDMAFVSLQFYMFISMVFLAATILIIPFIYNFLGLLIAFSVYGLFQGSLIVRLPVLLHTYMGKKEESIAMGAVHFLSGLVGFSLSYVIGYFRDTLGSYNYMFYANSAIIGVFAALWLLEPRIVKWTEKRNNPKEDS